LTAFLPVPRAAVKKEKPGQKARAVSAERDRAGKNAFTAFLREKIS
jgi:hypothetical protein